MPKVAKRFREWASECRAIAKSVRCETDAALLEDIAAELELEASKRGRRHADASNANEPHKDSKLGKRRMLATPAKPHKMTP